MPRQHFECLRGAELADRFQQRSQYPFVFLLLQPPHQDGRGADLACGRNRSRRRGPHEHRFIFERGHRRPRYLAAPELGQTQQCRFAHALIAVARQVDKQWRDLRTAAQSEKLRRRRDDFRNLAPDLAL